MRNLLNRQSHRPNSTFQAYLLLTILAFANNANAEDDRLRVQSKIFRDGTVVDHQVTLISTTHIYDFSIKNSREVVVVERDLGIAHFLDMKRRQKSEFTREMLFQYAADMQTRAKKLPMAIQSLATPVFAEDWEADSNQLTLSNQWASYRARLTVGPSPNSHAHLREAVDWSARLNATHPRSYPPGARLRLNRAMFDRRMVPASVDFTLRLVGTRIHLRSEHAYETEWTADDQNRVQLANTSLASFESVDFVEFRKN